MEPTVGMPRLSLGTGPLSNIGGCGAHCGCEAQRFAFGRAERRPLPAGGHEVETGVMPDAEDGLTGEDFVCLCRSGVRIVRACLSKDALVLEFRDEVANRVF